MIRSTMGDPEIHWLPWMDKQLRARGPQVLRPAFPTPGGQTLPNWLDVVETQNIQLTPETILAGHSVGTPVYLQLLAFIPVDDMAVCMGCYKGVPDGI